LPDLTSCDFAASAPSDDARANAVTFIDVAFDCGYASQSAFTAMFRRHFGRPPSEFYR
jgi:AraC-like DNA-binding protein